MWLISTLRALHSSDSGSEKHEARQLKMKSLLYKYTPPSQKKRVMHACITSKISLTYCVHRSMHILRFSLETLTKTKHCYVFISLLLVNCYSANNAAFTLLVRLQQQIGDKKSPAAAWLPEMTDEVRLPLNTYRGTCSVLTSCISLVWKLPHVWTQSRGLCGALECSSTPCCPPPYTSWTT